MTNSMLIDTHSHLYVEQFDQDREAAVERAIKAGVGTMMLPAIDSNYHEAMFALARRHPECKPMIGFHPTTVNDNPRWRDELAIVEKYLAAAPVRIYGIGETGIDLHWSRDFLGEQIEAFEAQIELTIKHDLPLIIHARDAWDEIFGVLEKYRGRGLRGIMHAFSGGVEEYRRARYVGDFLLGISGVATYRKNTLGEVIAEADIEHLVLETDCPYLTPEPHRGTRNESAYIPLIRDRVALIRGVPPPEIERATTLNAQRIFSL